MNAATNPQSISRWQAWKLAIRPKTLPAAVGPVLVGAALAVADRGFRPWPALAALAGALLLQIISNLANDYYDYVKGYDQADRKGPTRVALSGLLPLGELRLGLILALLSTALIGLYLIVVGGWPILAIGLAAMISAIIYSGGPFPLTVHGLGDLFVFIFFGLAAVVGAYYVQTLTTTPLVWLAAVPPGLLITAILVVNNLRDIKTDGRVGKRTLAVRLGPDGARREYAILMALAYLAPLLLWLLEIDRSGHLTLPTVLLTWLTLPLALRLHRSLDQYEDGPAMNRALAGTARLSLLFSLLLAVGLIF